jgi:hypothetical protein
MKTKNNIHKAIKESRTAKVPISLTDIIDIFEEYFTPLELEILGRHLLKRFEK